MLIYGFASFRLLAAEAALNGSPYAERVFVVVVI